MPLHFAVLIIGHLFADFIFQSRHMARNKSIDPQWLLRHGIIQWVVFFDITLFFFKSWREAAAFAGINALIHCAIDWHIWKGYKAIVINRLYGGFSERGLSEGRVFFLKKYEYWEDYWFYTFIGIDQCLHVLTLILLYQAFV